jgi:hypothetical protein
MYSIMALKVAIAALLIGILAGIFILLARSQFTWRGAAQMAKRQFYWWFHYSP